MPLLKSLHWLPVHYRIIFKICIISYQALASKQPTYLNSMLTPARNSRELRSTSSNPLYTPRVKTKAGTRTFSVAAPTLWNSLPVSVKSEGNIVSFRTTLSAWTGWEMFCVFRGEPHGPQLWRLGGLLGTMAT